MTNSSRLDGAPAVVAEFARQAVDYVRRSVGVEVQFDSETLPLLDHYLKTVPKDEAAAELVAAAVGAYFGEVVRRCVGGQWLLPSADDVDTWRIELPGGLSFSPMAIAVAAISRTEAEIDSGFDAPPKMKAHLHGALERMGQVTEEDYYSMSGRFDTIEHVQSVMLAVAAEEASKRS